MFLAVKQQLRLRDPASGSRNQAGNLEQQKKKRDRTAKISGIQRLSANRKSRASKRRPMRENEFHTDRRLQTEKSSHANGEPCWRADLSRTGAGRKTWTEAEHATEERIQSTANRSRRLGNRRSCVGSDRIGSGREGIEVWPARPGDSRTGKTTPSRGLLQHRRKSLHGNRGCKIQDL
jgi:hypothetical protein